MSFAAFGSLIGGHFSGLANKATNDAYADMNITSAQSAVRQAQAVRRKAKWQIGKLQEQKRQMLGANSFLAGRAGIEMSGTAKDIQDFTTKQVELDAQQVYTDAETQYNDLMEKAKAYKKAAKKNRLAGKLGYVGSLFGAAGSVPANSWGKESDAA